jgi:DNA-binding NtrC family response regulator
MATTTILIIDDEPVVCDGCRMVLTDNNYRVIACRTGMEGLRALRTERFDLLLLDMKLPDTDGMEILRRVRAEQPDLYVIVMTGYSTVANAVEAMKLGAFDYLTKPFTDDQLVFSVGKALENKHLREENITLRSQLFERYDFNNIIGENPRVLEIFEKIRRVAPTDTIVLLEGESGTGKELFARAVHANSPRSARQFIAVDCSTFSTSLMESELFGHVKGAFTGAIAKKAGIFEIADGGTLFLDEIANLNLDIQGKLLRVMETQEFKPVGAGGSLKTDTRIIAATNRNLKQLVDEGRFRDDLYYRLNVLPIYLPPLRERADDIARLAYHFLRLFCRKMGKRIRGFSDEALSMLTRHPWPGNVRQLKNVVERLVILSDHELLSDADVFDHMKTKPRLHCDTPPATIEELKRLRQRVLEEAYRPAEKSFLVKALTESGGNITRAAGSVGMQRSNFSALMKKHGLSAAEVMRGIEKTPS